MEQAEVDHALAQMARLERARLEEFQDLAATLQARFGPEWRVEAGRHWKGFGLTLYLPRAVWEKARQDR